MRGCKTPVGVVSEAVVGRAPASAFHRIRLPLDRCCQLRLLMSLSRLSCYTRSFWTSEQNVC